MCLLASVTGLLFRGLPIDILAQIGFVVLVGLAAKYAILIGEFARQAQDAGSSVTEAAAVVGTNQAAIATAVVTLTIALTPNVAEAGRRLAGMLRRRARRNYTRELTADRIGLELALGWSVALDLQQLGDAVTLQAAMPSDLRPCGSRFASRRGAGCRLAASRSGARSAGRAADGGRTCAGADCSNH